MKILLNKLKAGRRGNAESNQVLLTHSLRRAAFMHYAHKHAGFVLGAVNNHGRSEAALASASDGWGGSGGWVGEDWGKADSLSALRRSPSPHSDTIDLGGHG